MSVIVARCSKVLRSSFMENSKRCLDFARHDKRLGHVRAYDEDVRCRSSLRASLKFCVLQAWSKSAEINHEAPEGHKEFGREGAFATFADSAARRPYLFRRTQTCVIF